MTKTLSSNNPKISIIVPTYNRPEWLNLTLQSLITQSYTNIEVVVVNDAGKDVSELINGFNDKRIKYFVNEKNKDLAGTRNVGLENCTGDYISLLDDDDTYLKYALEFRMGMMKKLGAQIVYTRALQNIFERVEYDNGLYGYKLIHRQLYWDSPFSKDLILVQNIAPCCCPLFSRKAWEQAGNYRFKENLTTSEDWDFWVHLSRHNDFYELSLVDCECSYRKDGSQMTGSRTGFTDHLPMLYKEWREFANNKEWVAMHQNNSLKSRGLNPEDYNL